MLNLEKHLYDRRLDADLHTVWTDADERTIVFPLWNLSGQLVGYQQYRPDVASKKINDPRLSRYFTYRNKDAVAVWGLESWSRPGPLFVTEGVFDASRLTWNGAAAVALVSNDPNSATRAWFRIVRAMRPVVAVCDDDAAGRKLAKVGHTAHVVEGGDMGDQTDKYARELIEEYHSCGS